MVWNQLLTLAAVVGLSGAVAQQSWGPGPIPNPKLPAQPKIPIQNNANNAPPPSKNTAPKGIAPKAVAPKAATPPKLPPNTSPPDVTLVASHHQANWGTSDCNFQNYRPRSGLPGAAISPRYWFNSRACGGCIRVTDKSTGRSVVAMVADTCEECDSDIALYDEAWAYLAPLSQDTMYVSWEGTSCEHPDPLQIKFARDLDTTYFSVQVLNNNYPVTELLVKPTGQTIWGKTEAQYWNVFNGPEDQGPGPVVDILIDCSEAGGGQVLFEGVRVQRGQTYTARNNC